MLRQLLHRPLMMQPAVAGTSRDSGVQKLSSYPSFHFVDSVFISIHHFKYVLTDIQLESETFSRMECCMFRRKMYFSKRTDSSVFYCTYLCNDANHSCINVWCCEEAGIQIRNFDCRSNKTLSLCVVLTALTDY
jgi:hypothetical protein